MMESFLTCYKRKCSSEPTDKAEAEPEEPTEFKLAILSSLHPAFDQEALLDILLAHDGSVSEASASLRLPSQRAKGGKVIGYQQSLKRYTASKDSTAPGTKRFKSKKGSTLHLYDPEDIAEHTPCTIVHNFLPPDEANDLLKELLGESKSFEKVPFQMFDNVVSSPHTSSFYVESYNEIRRQKTEYHYNGTKLTDIRRITPQLAKVKPKVQETVNAEVQNRIKSRYPGGKKLLYQPPNQWVPNAAFVNCYNGPQESVGWHSDRLTYLGPRPVIGSLSLGVAREFRVRRVMPKDNDNKSTEDIDPGGQISIHLPHNSLLVMHAEMQEEWKHCISAAPSIDPHPIAGAIRINITYRDYRENMHPKNTPKCPCKAPCVLRVVQKKKENFGRYFWMCYGSTVPDRESCGFFQWAEFDNDGNPLPDKKASKASR